MPYVFVGSTFLVVFQQLTEICSILSVSDRVVLSIFLEEQFFFGNLAIVKKALIVAQTFRSTMVNVVNSHYLYYRYHFHSVIKVVGGALRFRVLSYSCLQGSQGVDPGSCVLAPLDYRGSRQRTLSGRLRPEDKG
jgi:hypothetical protein